MPCVPVVTQPRYPGARAISQPLCIRHFLDPRFPLEIFIPAELPAVEPDAAAPAAALEL
jgi:hypothetical protein